MLGERGVVYRADEEAVVVANQEEILARGCSALALGANEHPHRAFDGADGTQDTCCTPQRIEEVRP